MRLFKEILEKLFERKYIDKETKEKSDYDLLMLTKILKKRRENKNCISMLKKKNMELDTFYDTIPVSV